MKFQAYNLKNRCQKLFIYFARRVPFWSFLIYALERPVTLEITETAFSRVMPSAQNPEIGSKKVEHPWNRNHHFFSAVQGDIAIESADWVPTFAEVCKAFITNSVIDLESIIMAVSMMQTFGGKKHRSG